MKKLTVRKYNDQAYFVSDGLSNYLWHDGQIHPLTAPNMEELLKTPYKYGYWKTEKEAKEALDEYNAFQIIRMDIYYTDLTQEAQETFDKIFGGPENFNHDIVPLFTYEKEMEDND
jgi:hypothetical protein